MTYGSDEYWEVRRAELLRAERRRRVAHFVDVIINAVLALLLIGAILGICYLAKGREVRERAAYNEGRWGVDRATALAMAEQGVGKTADEVLSTDYTDFHGWEVR